MMVTLHPSSSSSLPTSLHIIFTPPPLLFIPSTHTLHSVCSTDFLPPVSLPQFYPPHLDSLSPCSCTPPTQIFASTPPLLLSISASDLALLLLLLGLSLTGYIIPPPFLLPLAYFLRFYQFLPSSRLQHPPASCLSLLLWLSAFSHLASASCPARVVCLLPPFCFSFFFAVHLWSVN